MSTPKESLAYPIGTAACRNRYLPGCRSSPRCLHHTIRPTVRTRSRRYRRNPPTVAWLGHSVVASAADDAVRDRPPKRAPSHRQTYSGVVTQFPRQFFIVFKGMPHLPKFTTIQVNSSYTTLASGFLCSRTLAPKFLVMFHVLFDRLRPTLRQLNAGSGRHPPHRSRPTHCKKKDRQLRRLCENSYTGEM